MVAWMPPNSSEHMRHRELARVAKTGLAPFAMRRRGSERFVVRYDAPSNAPPSPRMSTLKDPWGFRFGHGGRPSRAHQDPKLFALSASACLGPPSMPDARERRHERKPAYRCWLRSQRNNSASAYALGGALSWSAPGNSVYRRGAPRLLNAAASLRDWSTGTFRSASP